MLIWLRRLISRWWSRNVAAPDPWELLPSWTVRRGWTLVECWEISNGRRWYVVPLTRDADAQGVN